ncbi:MAG: ABC transporter permease [Gaiellaceae bacterium]
MTAGAVGLPAGSRRRAFLALCQRDLWVTLRYEPLVFLAQALLQPTFYLFVFGRVLPEIGATGPGYVTQLMPGVMALTLVIASLQNAALPLVIELWVTKEVEDRLLAPLSVAGVAIQKMTISALRGVLASLLILPLAAVILPGGLHVTTPSWPAFAAVLALGSLTGSAMGIVLGTAVPPNRISVAFAIVLNHLIFTGAAFYPWTSLGHIEWFQVLTLLNPLTYASEGLRATLTSLDHLPLGWVLLGLTAWLLVFGTLAVRGFVRRSVD